jgi:hypothetical protein
MLLPSTPTTVWMPSPTSCSRRCSKLQPQKTFVDYYPTRINQGSRLRRPTRSFSRTTGWKWIRSSPPFTQSRTNLNLLSSRNRMSLLSNLCNGSNQGNKPTTGAAIDHEDKTTEATATIARTTTRTPISPETTSPETVNTVFIAK